MEAQTNATLSKKDEDILLKFTNLITFKSDADSIRKNLTKLFFQYSRLLLVAPESLMSLDDTETETGLYFLSEIISLLDIQE